MIYNEKIFAFFCEPLRLKKSEIKQRRTQRAAEKNQIKNFEDVFLKKTR